MSLFDMGRPDRQSVGAVSRPTYKLYRFPALTRRARFSPHADEYEGGHGHDTIKGGSRVFLKLAYRMCAAKESMPIRLASARRTALYRDRFAPSVFLAPGT